MKTTALIEIGKDGTYGIYTPDIESTIIGEGDTVAEAKEDFENSVKEVFEAYRDNGLTIPGELDGIEFEYKYDLASFFDYFDFLNVSKFAKRIGINGSLMRHYKNGDTYVSESRIKEIEEGIHAIGRELQSVSL